MSRSLALSMSFVVSIALSAAVAIAQTAAVPSTPEPTAGLFTPRVKPTAMVAELLQSVEAERVQIAELRRALASKRSASDRLEVLRRIERIKLDGEVGRMRVQIGYAQREGRRAVAESLEKALSLIEPPATPGQPIARPVSDAR